MGRQFAIAVAGIVVALMAVSLTVVAAATWVQDRGDEEPPPPPRVATAFGAVASLLTGEGMVVDDTDSPATIGPATLTLAGAAPVEVPSGTPLYGSVCDVIRPAIANQAAAPIAAGTEVVTADLPPCFMQIGVAPDGRVEWLLGFAAGTDGPVISGDLRGVQAELVVLEDGSTVPGASAPLAGCEALGVTTLAAVAALDADVVIRVDPASGVAIDISCTF